MGVKNWKIIENETLGVETYSYEEVRVKRTTLAKNSMLLRSDAQPIFAGDDDGFIALENPKEEDRPSSIFDINIEEAFADKTTFSVQGTWKVDSTLFTKKSNNKRGILSLNVIKKFLKKNRIKISYFIVGMLVAMIVFLIPSTLSMEIPNSVKASFSEIELQARDYSRSIKVLDDLVSAKLGNNAQKYAFALLDLEGVRGILSSNQVPSSAYALSVVLTSLPEVSIYSHLGSASLLKNLILDAKSKLPLLAFETVKLEKFAVQKTGLQIKFGSDDYAFLRNSLGKIRVFMGTVLFSEKIIRNRLLARALWASMFSLSNVTNFENSQESKFVFAEINNIISDIPTPDRQILQNFLDELSMVFSQKQVNYDVILNNRIKTIELLQTETDFLCSPLEGASVIPYMMQTFSMLERYPSKHINFLPVLENCLTGYRNFFPGIPMSDDARGERPIALYLPPVADLDSLRLFFEKIGSKEDPINYGNISVLKLSTVVWKIQNGFKVSQKITPEQAQKMCTYPKINKQFCLNLKWAAATSVTEKIAILPLLAADFSKDTVHHAALNLAATVLGFYKGYGQDVDKNTNTKEVIEYLLSFMEKQMIEYDTLNWYWENHAEFGK